jgi:hypothetical protein
LFFDSSAATGRSVAALKVVSLRASPRVPIPLALSLCTASHRATPLSHSPATSPVDGRRRGRNRARPPPHLSLRPPSHPSPRVGAGVSSDLRYGASKSRDGCPIRWFHLGFMMVVGRSGCLRCVAVDEIGYTP